MDNVEMDIAPAVVMAVDVKSVGQYEKDPTFAIGWAVSVDGVHVSGGQAALNLGISDYSNLKRVWKERGWEMRCYREHWSAFEDVFKSLQDATRKDLSVVDSRFQLATHFVIAVEDAYNLHDSLIIVTDTVSSAPSRLNHLLQTAESGYFSITHTPISGKHVSWMCVDSVLQGAADFTSNTPWTVVMDVKERLSDKYPLLYEKATTLKADVEAMQENEPCKAATKILELWCAINRHQLKTRNCFNDTL